MSDTSYEDGGLNVKAMKPVNSLSNHKNNVILTTDQSGAQNIFFNRLGNLHNPITFKQDHATVISLYKKEFNEVVDYIKANIEFDAISKKGTKRRKTIFEFTN